MRSRVERNGDSAAAAGPRHSVGKHPIDWTQSTLLDRGCKMRTGLQDAVVLGTSLRTPAGLNRIGTTEEIAGLGLATGNGEVGRLVQVTPVVHQASRGAPALEAQCVQSADSWSFFTLREA